MLGMLFGLKGWFEASGSNYGFWTTVLIVCAGAFGPLYQLKLATRDIQCLSRPSLKIKFFIGPAAGFLFFCL